MSKFKPYSRRELKRRRHTWAKKNTQVIAIVVGCMAGLAAVLTVLLLLTWPDNNARSYLIGIVHAGLVGATLHLLNSGFLAHDREAIWHVRGAWGEENTRDELQRARRKGLIWGWVDSINLQSGDIDHVVVTRFGGLVALDSKWRSQTDAKDTAAMARDASKARSRAEGIARTLLKAERGTHRARTNPVHVQPAVVIWGPVQHTMPDGAHVGGVPFVAGRDLRPWLASLQGHEVPKEAATDLLEQLKRYRESSWQDA